MLELAGFGDRADPIQSGMLALLVVGPAGAIELETDQNRMPGEPRFDRFRRDGDRAVIAGDVELAFRTAHRQLEVKIKGQPDRVFHIGLTDKAPHATGLGPWQPNADGSEIRYRAEWPGRD